MRPSKKRSAIFACVFSLALLASGFALAADDSTVKAGTKQAESGKIAAGVEERMGQRPRRGRRSSRPRC